MSTVDEEVEESSRRIDVELFIVHPTMDPTEIGEALGLDAKFVHKVGAPRVTPAGTRLHGQYPDTRWLYTARHVVKGQHFADKVAALVDRLEPHREFLRHVRATGGSATVVLQFLGDGYLGDAIPLATVAKMADLHLDFGIECFMVRQN